MVINCVAYKCNNLQNVNSKIPFHTFPFKRPDILKLWINAIKRDKWYPSKTSRLCGVHFTENDYRNTSGCSLKLLKFDAVPSVFNFPKHLIRKKKIRREIIKHEKPLVTKIKEMEVDLKRSPKVQKAVDVGRQTNISGEMERVVSNMGKKKIAEVEVRSRRAASKEALKQMQLLLEDDEAFEIPSDDDVVVPVEPPRKKYKVSHRKSSDGNDRDVIVLKSISNHYVPSEDTLELECVVEELSEIQKARRRKWEEEEQEMMEKIEQLSKAKNTEVIYKGEINAAYQVTELINKANQPLISAANAVNSADSSYQLVMDPRLGIIVGTVQKPGQQQQPQTAPMQPKLQIASAVKQAATLSTSSPQPKQTRTRRSGLQQTTASPQTTPPQKILNTQAGQATRQTRTGVLQTKSATAQAKTATLPQAKNTLSQTRTVAMAQSRTSTVQTRNVQNLTQKAAAPGPATAKRTVSTKEATVEGGLNVGNTRQAKGIVDLTEDKTQADNREISFNKLQGKTYPSLVVVARPHLRVTDLGIDRPKLDQKVKAVLMHPATKFTEWLIQQGLVRSEQRCPVHGNTQLKLGMYSETSKFPYSGGYVWISECCPQRFISVFNGSIFEGSPNPPMVMLKLLYHWACQTNIQNVTQWVKVDNLYVKGVYTWIRAACTVAVHTHIRQLGGPGSRVEVGVISLGTTSHDGNQRQVKVEVLGVLESSSKFVRLRAVEPMAEGDRNYKKKFTKILEPIVQWVHPSSIIVTDLTVDKSTLHAMGFSQVQQTTSNDYNNSNRTIMEYLRRIVPRMFQNTLSLLSRQIIQQFLDELVWREWFGVTSCQAFDNIVLQLAEQTRASSTQSLVLKLNKVAQNPFKNWSLNGEGTQTTPSVSTATKTIVEQVKNRIKGNRKTNSPQVIQASQEVQRPSKSTSPDLMEAMVPLENYYYGTIETVESSQPNTAINMKCPFCKRVFDNNISLQSHLFKHAHNVSNDAQVCRYCLAVVFTRNELANHIASSHPSETKFDNGFVCLICETHYMNPFILGKHMSKEHCPQELPYECGTCSYRCSNHKQAIDHFYLKHDGGITIQCPFCLKSTIIYSGGRNITQNVNYFIQHLQKHQKKHLAKRCGKCNLWFIQKDVLKEHQNKMHVSLRGRLGLMAWPANRNGILVPKSRIDKDPGDAEVIDFSSLYYNIPNASVCKECDNSIQDAKHFPSFATCQNASCQYSTCCANAMMQHRAKCKGGDLIIPTHKLPYEMFCVCGFREIDGNSMAKHLAICERKSAYPSIEDAKTATVTHSMLDVLGLVRKPEETSEVAKITQAPTPLDTGAADAEVNSVDEVVNLDEVSKTSDADEQSSVADAEMNSVDEVVNLDDVSKASDADEQSEKNVDNVVEVAAKEQKSVEETDSTEAATKETEVIAVDQNEDNAIEEMDAPIKDVETVDNIQSEGNSKPTSSEAEECAPIVDSTDEDFGNRNIEGDSSNVPTDTPKDTD